MDKVLADKKAICLLVLPAFLLFVGIILLPVVISGYYSTLQWDGIGTGIFIGLRNYLNLFQSGRDGFQQSVGNAFILAALSVFVQLPLALFFALVLTKGVKGENFYRTVYFIPVIISTVAIGQLWLKVYHPSYGLLNSLLGGMGLAGLTREWLGRTDTAMWSALIPVVWQYIGYHMLLMYTAAKSVPNEIYEAALMDGASAVATACKVTIPLIMPTLKVCVTFAVIGSLRSFDLIYILTNGGPVHATEMPSTVMFNAIFQKYMYGYGSAISVLIILACFILTIVIQKSFKAEPI